MLRLLSLLVLVVVIVGACEDRKLKQAKAEAEAWRTQAYRWQETAYRCLNDKR